jgi:hypothetical protein
MDERVTYTTFAVQDVLKGSAEAVHTIKQVGGRLGDENYRIEGVPAFAVGQDYIVFLYGVSGDGFSSPVGLSQGQFLIRASPGGQEIFNGRDFREMLPKPTAQGLSQAQV